MYYTYCYLNEDGKPYYIGRGSGDRVYDPTTLSLYRPEIE